MSSCGSVVAAGAYPSEGVGLCLKAWLARSTACPMPAIDRITSLAEKPVGDRVVPEQRLEAAYHRQLRETFQREAEVTPGISTVPGFVTDPVHTPAPATTPGAGLSPAFTRWPRAAKRHTAPRPTRGLPRTQRSARARRWGSHAATAPCRLRLVPRAAERA